MKNLKKPFLKFQSRLWYFENEALQKYTPLKKSTESNQKKCVLVYHSVT